MLGQPAVLAAVGAVAIAGLGVGLGLALHGSSPHRGAPALTGQVHGGLGGGVAVIPPLTSGPPPGNVVPDGRQSATTQQDNSAESSPAPSPGSDNAVSGSASPTPAPPTAPPGPTPLIDLHPRTTQVSPLLPYAGADVVIYNPTDSSAPPPTVNVILPPLPASASRFRSY
jgi:hypothetical protein